MLTGPGLGFSHLHEHEKPQHTISCGAALIIQTSLPS